VVEYRLNLIRGRVVPAPRRKMLFAGTTACLGLYAVVLAWGIHGAVKRVIAATYDRRRIALVEEHFRRKHGTEETSVEYAARVGREIEACTARILAADAVLSRRTDTVRILLGLSNHLPPGLTIKTFNLDHAERRLTLELTVSREAADGDLSSALLIRKWQSEPLLSEAVREIKSVSKKTQEVGRNRVSIWEFSCKLNG
jgi:hypothetical protein